MPAARRRAGVLALPLGAAQTGAMIANLAHQIGRILHVGLFTVHGTTVTPASLLVFVVLAVVTVWVARIAKAVTHGALARRLRIPEASAQLVARLVHYAVLVLGFGIALQTLGVDLVALFATGAFFNFTLFTLHNTKVTLLSLLVFVLMALLSVWAARLAKVATHGALSRRPNVSDGSARAVGRLVQYIVLVVGFAIAVQTLGVDLASLLAAGAFLAVGVGIAMQGVAQNFVSGVSLLIERTIKPDDILKIDNQVVRITSLGFRAAVARTRDEEDLIIPNSLLAQQVVTNYTLHDSLFRLRTNVGVAYESDIDDVFRVLRQVGMDAPDRDPKYEPRVLLTDFGGSSINFDLSIWIENSWIAPVAKSRLNHAIWRAFKDRGITIAFPQMDVHFDRPPEPPPPKSPPAS